MESISDMVKGNIPAAPRLVWNRSDIERRLLFPAGRFTNPGPLLAPLLAAVLMAGFYVLLGFYPAIPITPMFTERGVVPYVIVYLSAWSIMILFVKARKLALQRKVLSVNIVPTDDPGFILTPTSAENVLEKVYQSVDDPGRFLLTRRIEIALSNLRNMGHIGDVDDVLTTQADNDEGLMESSYTIIKGLIWAIPVLGFIGTVWGLSVALGSFCSVLANAGKMDQLKSALQGVTGGLSTAFETTLVALVAALALHLLMVMIRRREEQFLDDCRDYCHKCIVGKLRLIRQEGREDA